jgi:tetratricopeptide (TPR) repeat protein
VGAELAKYFSAEHQRPVIAKIHGDIFHKTYNAVEDIEKLRKQWETPLRSIFKSYIPIFIGYGGNDPGFMEFLIKEPSNDWLPNGLIWTYRPKSGLPNNSLIQKLAAKHHGRFVPIPGFDEFLLLLGDVFEIGKLDKTMEAENAKRVDQYRKSFDSVIVTLRDNQEFTDVEHYPDLVHAVISRLAGEKTARGWWDWQVEANKETSPDKALLIYNEAMQFLPDSPQLLGHYIWFLTENFPSHLEAEVIAKRAIELAEKSLGAEHPDTLTNRSNLASLYQARGEYEKALPLMTEVLDISERVLGAEHPDTLARRNNVALLYKVNGKYDKAKPLYERILAINERVLGMEHIGTLIHKNNMATLYGAMGEYDKALSLFEQILPISERVLGMENPDTLSFKNNLAMLYVNQKEYDKAQPLLEQILSLREQTLGTENPSTINSQFCLAELYKQKNEYNKALLLFEKALKTSEKVLGQKHPITQSVLDHLQKCREKLKGAEENETVEL